MIYYLVPSTEKPSWGLAILYHHVNLLLSNNIPACIVKEGNLKCPKWLEVDVKFCSFKEFIKRNISEDKIIVPEVMINLKELKSIRAYKILFLQAGGFLFHSMPKNETHKSLGFNHVWIIMEHMKEIVKKHVEIPYTLIPPFIAPYFNLPIKEEKRKNQILIFPKFDQIDYSIVRNIINNHLIKINKPKYKDLFKGNNWQLKEMHNLSHQEVAQEMQRSSIFISLNCFEALNTSVVESMAAGSLVFCYDGYGPREYLVNSKNAITFNNNEPYLLAESVCDWIDNFDDRKEQLNRIKESGIKTARSYNKEETKKALLNYFNAIS